MSNKKMLVTAVMMTMVTLLFTSLFVFGSYKITTVVTRNKGANFCGSENNPMQISDLADIGIQFSIAEDAIFVGVSCPSWGNDIGELTFTLYKYDTSYDKTIEGKPIYEYTFKDYPDNATLGFEFGSSNPLEKGEYVFVLSDGYDRSGSGVGLWTGKAYPGQAFYVDGVYLEDISAKMRVDLVTTPKENPYGQLTGVPVSEKVDENPAVEHMIMFDDEKYEHYIDFEKAGEGVNLKVENDNLRISISPGADPYFYINIPQWVGSNPLSVKRAGAMLVKLRILNSVAPLESEVYFDTSDYRGYTEYGKVPGQYERTTDWQYVIYDLSSNRNYPIEGAWLEGLKYKMFDSVDKSILVRIEYILFFANAKSAELWKEDFKAVPTVDPSIEFVPVSTPAIEENTPAPSETPSKQAVVTPAPTTTVDEQPAPKDNVLEIASIVLVVFVVVALVGVSIIIATKK